MPDVINLREYWLGANPYVVIQITGGELDDDGEVYSLKLDIQFGGGLGQDEMFELLAQIVGEREDEEGPEAVLEALAADAPAACTEETPTGEVIALFAQAMRDANIREAWTHPHIVPMEHFARVAVGTLRTLGWGQVRPSDAEFAEAIAYHEGQMRAVGIEATLGQPTNTTSTPKAGSAATEETPRRLLARPCGCWSHEASHLNGCDEKPHGAHREEGKTWTPNHDDCAACDELTREAHGAIHPDVLAAEDGA